jgi:hypothetical protein
MVKITTTIQVYEVDGRQLNINRPEIKIHNHEYRESFVVLEIDGKRYTVLANALQVGIRNGTSR